MKLLLNDLIKQINDKTKLHRFLIFVKFKGYSNPQTDIIEFYSMILSRPEWFKDLNNNSFKSLNTQKNIISSLKTIWEMEIIKDSIDEGLFLNIKRELIKFYNEITHNEPNILKQKIKDLEKIIKEYNLDIEKRLDEINKLIYNI